MEVFEINRPNDDIKFNARFFSTNKRVTDIIVENSGFIDLKIFYPRFSFIIRKLLITLLTLNFMPTPFINVVFNLTRLLDDLK